MVDRSKQTATVYNNDQVVQTFNVCTGKTGKHETTPGNYFIYLKYQVQDMRGTNDDGSQYLTKGVKWISYFNGGQASYGGLERGWYRIWGSDRSWFPRLCQHERS